LLGRGVPPLVVDRERELIWQGGMSEVNNIKPVLALCFIKILQLTLQAGSMFMLSWST
jgi:hypothetical protein